MHFPMGVLMSICGDGEQSSRVNGRAEIAVQALVGAL